MKRIKVWEILPESPLPEGFNYKLWLGPAPYKPYCENRTQPQCWRQIEDYAAGTLTDWGMHLCDTAQVANFSGPLEWDPNKEEFVNDAEANALRSRPVSTDWMNA